MILNDTKISPNKCNQWEQFYFYEPAAVAEIIGKLLFNHALNKSLGRGFEPRLSDYINTFSFFPVHISIGDGWSKSKPSIGT